MTYLEQLDEDIRRKYLDKYFSYDIPVPLYLGNGDT